MRTHPFGRIAAMLVALEAAGLVALVAWQMIALVSDDTASIDTAVALLVLTAIGAAAVASFAVAIWRGRSWGRSGAIVTQVLILAIALGAATGSYAEPVSALALGAPALGVLVLLVLAVREAGATERGEPSA